jgi:D-tyrosyl-tRNA(Tyr) deacylase
VIALVQRVREARVEVAGRVTGSIGPGLLVLRVRRAADDEAAAARLVDKLLKLRIFATSPGKMNRSVQDTGGGLLVVSQFTLAADTSGGNRPSFTGAAPAAQGRALYERCWRWRVRPGCRWARASSAPTCRCIWSTTGRSRSRCASSCRRAAMKKAARGRPCGTARSASVGVLAGGLDGRAPLADLGLDELLVLGRGQAGVGDDHGAQRLLALDELGVLQRIAQCG